MVLRFPTSTSLQNSWEHKFNYSTVFILYNYLDQLTPKILQTFIKKGINYDMLYEFQKI